MEHATGEGRVVLQHRLALEHEVEHAGDDQEHDDVRAHDVPQRLDRQREEVGLGGERAPAGPAGQPHRRELRGVQGGSCQARERDVRAALAAARPHRDEHGDDHEAGEERVRADRRDVAAGAQPLVDDDHEGEERARVLHERVRLEREVPRDGEGDQGDAEGEADGAVVEEGVHGPAVRDGDPRQLHDGQHEAQHVLPERHPLVPPQLRGVAGFDSGESRRVGPLRGPGRRRGPPRLDFARGHRETPVQLQGTRPGRTAGGGLAPDGWRWWGRR